MKNLQSLINIFSECQHVYKSSAIIGKLCLSQCRIFNENIDIIKTVSFE